MGRPLLYVLLVILAGVVIYALTQKKPSGDVGDNGAFVEEDDVIEPVDPEIEKSKSILAARDLPGEEPAVPPVLHCDLSFEPLPDGKVRMNFTITEEHDYYVETFSIKLWKKGFESTPMFLWYDKYLKAKDTLVITEQLTKVELADHAGGELGTSEDWVVEIRGHRARAENPDPLPHQSD